MSNMEGDDPVRSRCDKVGSVESLASSKLTAAAAENPDAAPAAGQRIRAAVAALGGASVLARRLTETCGSKIGESGVRAWVAQGAVPLRRRFQMARLAALDGLTFNSDTLEVHPGPGHSAACGMPDLNTSPGNMPAFLDLAAVASRWGVSTERVEKAVEDGVLRVHLLVGEWRVSCTDLLAYERRARCRASRSVRE